MWYYCQRFSENFTNKNNQYGPHGVQVVAALALQWEKHLFNPRWSLIFVFVFPPWFSFLTCRFRLIVHSELTWVWMWVWMAVFCLFMWSLTGEMSMKFQQSLPDDNIVSVQPVDTFMFQLKTHSCSIGSMTQHSNAGTVYVLHCVGK